VQTNNINHHQTCNENKVINKKSITNGEFLFETFEGPSFNGGLDHTWIGWYFDENYGIATIDPINTNNYGLRVTQQLIFTTGEFHTIRIIKWCYFLFFGRNEDKGLMEQCNNNSNFRFCKDA